MANLFVANTTLKDLIFSYRLPEDPSMRIYYVTIPAGKQEHVLRDVTDNEFKSVVDHYRVYGMKTMSEAKKAGSAIGAYEVEMVYDDKPLPADVYDLVETVNKEIISNRIQREKELTAISLIKSVESNPELNEQVKSVELEIVEDVPKEQARKGKDRVIQKFKADINQ